MRHSTIIAVIVGVLTCTAVQAGDVYKYTDERGNTIYTDRPMPGAVRVSAGVHVRPKSASVSTPRSSRPPTSSSPPAISASRRARPIRAPPRRSPRISRPRVPSAASRRATTTPRRSIRAACTPRTRMAIAATCPIRRSPPSASKRRRPSNPSAARKADLLPEYSRTPALPAEKGRRFPLWRAPDNGFHL